MIKFVTTNCEQLIMSDSRYIDSRPIQNVTQELIRYYRCDDHIHERQVTAIWESVVGKMVARHTRNLTVRKYTLTVWMDSAAIKEELNYSKNTIILAINKAIKQEIIKDIIIK